MQAMPISGCRTSNPTTSTNRAMEAVRPSVLPVSRYRARPQAAATAKDGFMNSEG